MKRNRDTRYPGCWYYEGKEYTDNNGRKQIDRRFCFTVVEDGKKITVTHGWKSEGKTWVSCRNHRAEIKIGVRRSPQKQKTEVEARKAQAEAESDNNLDKVFERYSDQKGRNGKVRRTQAIYKSSLGHINNYIVPYFGEHRDLRTITFAEADAFKDRIDKAPQTVKHIIRLLKKLCRMVGNSLTGKDDTQIKVSVGKQHTREDLTEGQFLRLLEVLSSHPNRILADMLLFIMATGVRRGEALRLERRHIDFRRKRIFLENRKTSDKDMDIFIPMNRQAEVILKRRKKENLKSKGENDYIFPGKDGGKRYDAKRARSIMKAAGIPDTFRPCHGLRHFYACEMVDRGVQPTVLQKLMGHTDIATTMKYYEARESALVEAASQMDVALEV